MVNNLKELWQQNAFFRGSVVVAIVGTVVLMMASGQQPSQGTGPQSTPGPSRPAMPQLPQLPRIP